MNHVVRSFIARQIANEIVLEGSFTPDSLTRWIFSQITPNSFYWRNVVSNDHGTTWTLTQTREAQRAQQ